MVAKFKQFSLNDQLQEIPSDELDESGVAPQKGIKIGLYLRLLGRKRWMVALITAMTTGVGFYWNYKTPPLYSGNFYLLVQPITPYSKVTSPTTISRGGNPDEDLFSLDYPTNTAFLQSPGMNLQLAKAVAEKLNEKNINAITEDLRENLTISRLSTFPSKDRAIGSPTKILEVTYQGDDPQEVQAVLAVAAQVFSDYSVEDRETSLKAGIKFIDSQLPPIQERLKKLQLQQEAMRRKYELIDPLSKGQYSLDQVNSINAQILDIETQLKTQKTLYEVLKKQLKFNPQEALAASALSQDPARVALLSKLQDIETQIALEKSRFTFKSPHLEELEDQRQNIVNLLNQKTEEIIRENSLVSVENTSVLNYQDPTRLQLISQLIEANNQIQQLEVRYNSLKQTRTQWELLAKRYPELIRQYQELERQINLNSQLLDKFLTQKQTLQIDSAQQLPWQLVSPPQVPKDAEGNYIATPTDHKKRILAAAMGGLLLSLGLAVFLEKRKDIFYTVEDIQDSFSVPFLGDIPWDELPEILEHNSLELEVERLAKDFKYKVPERGVLFLKAFDLLYSELSFLYNNPPIHSLVVSSVESEDGQSTIALQLAKAAEATGRRVLLVDTNFNRPKLHEYLELSNQKGLSDLLTDNDLASYDVIQRSQDREGLFLLSAGSLHSSSTNAKMLWFPKMRTFMREFKVRYDLIIYDAPHFYDSTDIGFLGGQTDGILMVVGVAKTPQSLVLKAIREVEKLRLPLLGIVANHPQPSR